MKVLKLIIFSNLFFVFPTFASMFFLQGNVTGKESVNYAYIFDNSYKQLAKIEILNQKFQYHGQIPQNTKFGELSTVIILLSKISLSVDEIISRRLLSNRMHGNCTLIATDSVEITFNSDKKKFSIIADKFNETQSLFMNGYLDYRNSRDSVYALIDNSSFTEKEKEEKKMKEQGEMFTKAMRRFIDLVKVNSKSEVALLNFSPIIYDQAINGREAMDAFNYFSEDLRGSVYGQRLYKDIVDKLKSEELMAKPAYVLGMGMPRFALKNEKNQAIESTSIYSAYTLIDFWATWCIPCRKETPNVINAFAKYHKKGFNVITVSIDEIRDRAKWLEAIEKDKMMVFVNLFNGNDLSGLSKEMNIVSIPTNYLVDSKGKIVAKNLRGEMLIKKLEELFADKN